MARSSPITLIPPENAASLRDRIRQIEAGTIGGGEGPGRLADRARTGLAQIDATLSGGLERGAIHEIVGHLDTDTRHPWSPPLGWVTHLALAGAGESWIVWIGAEVFPYPQALAGRALDRSLFVEARTPAERIWCADLALRCGGVGCVVMDATRFDMGATRRLQLAAKRGFGGAGAIGLLARPPSEVHAISVASTRWGVRRRAGGGGASGPGWIVELLRCKGVQPDGNAQRSWAVEWCCGTCDVRVVADVVERSGPAPVETVERVRIASA